MTKGQVANVSQGVILAAGKGSRILPLSKKTPKPMLSVLNKPIMQYQIEAMSKAGIKEVIIVIGFMGNIIKNHFGSGRRYGVRISYVVDHNPQGIASSLYKAKGLIKSSFLCFLGDIFVFPKGLEKALFKMVGMGSKNVLLLSFERQKKFIESSAEAIISGKLVTGVVEKPKKPRGNLKTCGIYQFNPIIFELIEKTPMSPLRGEVELTDAIDNLIKKGEKVYFEKLQSWDINVTSASDLTNCNILMRESLKREKTSFANRSSLE